MKCVKSINVSVLEEKNKIYYLNKRPFTEWSFCIYNNQIKSSKLITLYKLSDYMYSCHMNQISRNKSQKKSKIFTLTY